MASPAQSIGELVEPLVITAGLELWDVEVNPRAVRVLVDRPGGVDLDAISALARAVSAALDDRSELTPPGGYQLEVSSPGVERTLRAPSHYQRFVGAVVAVKTRAAVVGRDPVPRRLQGVLLAADERGITIGADEGATELSYDQIQTARTVLLWGPLAKAEAAKGKMKDAVR